MAKTNFTVMFGRVAFVMRVNCTVTVNAGGEASYSNADNLVELNNQNVYATFENNYWLLDGSYHIVPDDGADIGYVSSQISDIGGLYSTTPVLQFDFNYSFDTNGLTLYFSENTGDYSDRITIAFYDVGTGGPSLIRSDTYFPTGTTFSTGQAVSSFNRIVITFTGTVKAYRRTRLVDIDFDTVTKWTGNNIKKGKLLEQINLLSTELPSNELEFNLYSDDGDFSITNPQNEYADLQENEPVEAYEQVGDSCLFLGRFYLDEWESINETEAHFVALDAIKLMDKIQYLHPYDYYDDWVTYEDLINRIFSIAGIEYEIDAGVTATGDHNILFKVFTCREILQLALFQLGAYATCTRSRSVKIYLCEIADDLVTYDHSLTTLDKSKTSRVELRKAVTSVTVDAYTNADYHLDSDREVFNETLATGTYIIVLENYALSTYTGTATYSIVQNGAYWAEINVTVSGTVIITENYNYKRSAVSTTIENSTLAAGTPRNDIIIDAVTLYYDKTIVDVITQRAYDYYVQRFIEKAKVYGNTILSGYGKANTYDITMKAGDSIIVETQSSQNIKGIIERAEYDLTGGFNVDLEIVGVIA